MRTTCPSSITGERCIVSDTTTRSPTRRPTGSAYAISAPPIEMSMTSTSAGAASETLATRPRQPTGVRAWARRSTSASFPRSAPRFHHPVRVNRYGPAVADRFDAAYYRRFYGRRPVHDRHRIGQLATAVLALAAWWHLPVRSVLDVGAGKGYWGSWLASSHLRVRYHGIDASPYACQI